MRLALAVAATLLLASATAQAVVIDFEADTEGAKPNGFVSASGAGVAFSDTDGAHLTVGLYAPQTLGRGLAAGPDGDSRLRMDFATHVTDLSLLFGNDDPGRAIATDRAWLALYDGATLVDTVWVTVNNNDIADQTLAEVRSAMKMMY